MTKTDSLSPTTKDITFQKMVKTYIDFVKQTARFAKRYNAVKEAVEKRKRVENTVRIIQQQLKLNTKNKLKED
jgi:hypothetical protein